MRRLLIAGFASLLAAALIAPVAQGATQVRHFQGEMSTAATLGIAPTPWEVDLDAVFKNKRANRKRFTPRLLYSIHLENVPLQCDTTPAVATGLAFLTTASETPVKVQKMPPPPKPKARPYKFEFGYSFPTLTGAFVGQFWKRTSTGDPQLHVMGNLKIDHVRPLHILWPPGFDPGDLITDCSTDGLFYWSVDRCRTMNESGSLPICRMGGAP